MITHRGVWFFHSWENRSFLAPEEFSWPDRIPSVELLFSFVGINRFIRSRKSRQHVLECGCFHSQGSHCVLVTYLSRLFSKSTCLTHSWLINVQSPQSSVCSCEGQCIYHSSWWREFLVPAGREPHCSDRSCIALSMEIRKSNYF